MKIEIDNYYYEVEVVKKKTTKNTYIRVKDNLKIVVTTNFLTPEKLIKRIIEENLDCITRMINKIKRKNEYNDQFYYLGKRYDIIYTNLNEITFGMYKVFVGKEIDLEKWIKKQAEKLYKERLDYVYSNFSRKIPYPSLTIRKMKSRWGVCNIKTKKITLNLELMKKELCCLDYVIVHELSHLLHPDHSKEFWLLVQENCPEYKKIRKLMKEY